MTTIIGLYYPLPANHIRLLNILPDRDGTIECILEAFDLRHRPGYDVLPCTCGNSIPDIMPSTSIKRKPPTPILSRISALFQTKTANVAPSTHKPSIIINGIPRAVTPNLYTTLLRLSEPDMISDTPIWIDDICIHQADFHEKASQVAMMGDIFKEAEGVLVWMGDILAKVAVRK